MPQIAKHHNASCRVDARKINVKIAQKQSRGRSDNILQQIANDSNGNDVVSILVMGVSIELQIVRNLANVLKLQHSNITVAQEAIPESLGNREHEMSVLVKATNHNCSHGAYSTGNLRFRFLAPMHDWPSPTKTLTTVEDGE